MADFSELQKLVGEGKQAAALSSFQSVVKSIGKSAKKYIDISALQVSQKLGSEFFKAEKYKEAKFVCDAVKDWTISISGKENATPADLETALGNNSSKPSISPSNLAKMVAWASLTSLQCASKLDKNNGEDEGIRSDAEALAEYLKFAMKKKLLDESIVISTLTKLRSVLCGRRSLQPRILAISLSTAHNLPWTNEYDRFLGCLLRDLRVEKFHDAKLEANLELVITAGKPRLCFDFALWLFETSKKEDDRLKAIQRLCKSATVRKECAFAVRQVIVGKSQGEASILKVALDTCVRGLKVESGDDTSDQVSDDDLVKMFCRLYFENGTNLDVPMLVEQEEFNERNDIIASKELEIVIRMRKLFVYLDRLSKVFKNDESSRSLRLTLWFARALRLEGKREEALKMLGSLKSEQVEDCMEVEAIFLRAVICNELGEQCLDDLMRLLEVDTAVIPSWLLKEASVFAWCIGEYCLSIRLSCRASMVYNKSNEDGCSSSEEGEEEDNNQRLFIHESELAFRRGSDAAHAIHRYGDDADTCVRHLSAGLAKMQPILSHFEEWQEVYDVLVNLSALGDVFVERALARQAKYYYNKARGIAVARKLGGFQRRLDERLERLQALQSTRSTLDGDGNDVHEEDEFESFKVEGDSIEAEPNKDQTMNVRPNNPEDCQVSDDALDAFFHAIHMSRIKSKPDSAMTLMLLSKFVRSVRPQLGSEEGDLWCMYERARTAVFAEHDWEKFQQIARRVQLLPTDTLEAEALVRRTPLSSFSFDDGVDESTMEEIRACAENCTSDLVLLRELYLRLALGSLNSKSQQQQQQISVSGGGFDPDQEDETLVNTNLEQAYLISSLVGLSLRAERARLMTNQQLQGEQEESNFDLFHWHRLKRIKDAARVQRAQIESNLDENLTVCTIYFEERLGRMFLCRTTQTHDVTLQWDVDRTEATAVIDAFNSIMRRNLEQTNGSTVEFAFKVSKLDKNKWWDARYELDAELGTWLKDFERVFFGWRAVLLRGKVVIEAKSDESRSTKNEKQDANKIHLHDDELELESEEMELVRETRNLSLADEEDAKLSNNKRAVKGTSRSTSKTTTTARKTLERRAKPVSKHDSKMEEEEDVLVVPTTTTKDPKTRRQRKPNEKEMLSLDDDHINTDGEPMPIRGRRIRFEDDVGASEVDEHPKAKSLSTSTAKRSLADVLSKMNLSHSSRLCYLAQICLESGLGRRTVVEALENLCYLSTCQAKELFEEFGCEYSRDDSNARSPIVLCLSGSLQQMPWESLPCLDGFPVSRVASLPFALGKAKNVSGERRRAGVPKAFFVNPQGNLSRTEQTLRSKLDSMAAHDKSWSGVYGSDLPKSELKSTIGTLLQQYLVEKQVVLYCGHGAGEEFLSRDSIANLQPGPHGLAVGLLMGCSSAMRKDQGAFEPNGVIDAYALAGSPLVVGNLWNVTDKDIDRFTLAMLDAIGEAPQELVKLVAQSRKACKLRYLVGAAPICFGLPYTL